MMNKRKLFNSKLLKVTISLLLTLVAILVVVFVYDEVAKQKAINDIMGQVNIDSGDVGYQGNLNDISTENSIKKLSENEFILDKEAKTISVDENLVGGSFCISSSPDGPTENDSWNVIENESISLNKSEQEIMQNQEEQKVYVYYMAGVASDMSNYNSSATTYIIVNEADLQAFRTKVNGGVNFSGKTVYLAKNITITETSFTPIGTSTAPFSGTFDGNGYTISGLNINSTGDYIGLFGYANATIKNVIVNGTSITGGSYVGAIAGYNAGTITNCTNNVAVTGKYAVGGIVGQSNGDVKFCKNTVAITSSVTETEKENYLGGIIGISDVVVTIYNCENSGTITGYGSYIGGIVGGITSNGAGSTVQYCTNYGSCSSSASGGNYIGGIVGFAVGTSKSNYTNILNCRNEGTITLTSGNHAGGIAGGNGYLYIEYCVNTGAINNQYTASGGILAYGATYCYVSRCYNRGAVTCTERGRAGGIVGFLSKGGYIHGCANTAAIKGCTQANGDGGRWQGVAGILGYSTDGATVQYSINIGNITGYRYTAGIVGCFSEKTDYKPTLKSVISYGTIKNTSGKATGIATFTYFTDLDDTSISKVFFGGKCNHAGDGSTDKKYFTYNNGASTNNTKGVKDSVSDIDGFDCTTIYDLVGSKKANNWAIAPNLIQNPFDVVRPVGTTATLKSIWIGANTEFTYQWYVANSETGEGTAVSGGTLTTFTGGATVTLDATVTNTNKWYYLVLSGVDYTGTATSVTTERALVGPGEDVLLDPGLSIRPTSLSIVYGATGTVTASRNGSGAITASSANASVATVSVSGTTISVVGKSVGSTTITVNLAANGAYTSVTKTFNVTVTRAKITVPTGTNRTYNGATQTGLSAGTGYTVGGTTSAKDAGTYTATATPTSNYQWSDGTTTAKNISWNISPKSIAVSWGDTTSFTYNGTAQGPTATATSGVTGETINLTTSKATNVGNYTSTASISSVSGGIANASNYTLTGTTKAFSIIKASSTNPTLTSTTATYDGSAHTIGVSGGSGGTIQYRSSTDGSSFGVWTPTKPTLTNAGKLYVQARIVGDSNHNDTSATSSATITINKASGSVVLSSPSGTITYPNTTTFTVTTNKSGGTLSVASSNSNVATAKISGTTVTVTAGTTSGSATITVTSAATSNYTAASNTYKVTVNNGGLSVTASGYSGTYDGKSHGISVSCSTSGATITYASSENGTYSATKPTYTDAGTNTIYYKVSLAGYTTVTGSETVTINKASTSVTGSITGETTVGKALTATATTVSNGAKSYQWWYSSTTGATSGTAISGATSSTYTITSSVVGYYIGVTVSVAEGTNYKACSGTAITTSKVAGTNYKDSAGNYYETLKEAFDNAVSGSTITVLKDVTDSSIAAVASGKTFMLNTNGKKITKTTAGITNNGTLTIQGSGTIQTAEIANNSLINLMSNTGTLTIKEATLENKGISTTYWYVIKNTSGTVNLESGLVKASGTDSTYNARGMYIDSGTINIKGGTIESNFICIHSYDNATGTINITNGTLTSGNYAALNISGTNNQTNLNITGGTIKSQSSFGITAITTGTVKIGTDDGTVNKTLPVIQGGTYGVNSSNGFYFYDGILKGKISGHNGNVVTASGYGIQYGTETIGGETYQTEILVLNNYSDGKSCYETLKEAFDNAVSGSTITVLKDVTESTQATVESGKSFVLDLNGKTITFNDTTYDSYIYNCGNLEVKDSSNSGKIVSTFIQESSEGRIILLNENGNLTITSGTYNLSGNNGWIQVIKNTSGTLNVNGGTLIAKGTNSESVGAIVVNAGNVNITGGIIKAYDETENQYVYGVVSSGYGSANIKITGGDIYGDIKGVELANHFGNSSVRTSTLEVSGNPTIEGGKYGIEIDGSTGNVQVKSGTIKGGTAGIRQTTGKIIIGDKSDKATITTPVIQGGTYGVNSSNGFYFYDGILKGKSGAYSISVSDPTIPTGYEIYHDTETIDGTEYKTAYLVPYLMQRETQETTDENGNKVYQNKYMLGAEHAGLTQYTSDLVSSIKLHDMISIPVGSPNWDVSLANDGSIMAWLVSNGSGRYELHIGANSIMFVETAHRLFANYINCTSITNLSLLDTRNVKDMHAMFLGLEKVSILDVNSFNTSNVTSMSYMFADCNGLINLKVNNFDTHNVKDMSDMFYGCKTLETLDVSAFNTDSVTNLKYTFGLCSKLQSLNLNNFNTENVVNMYGIFLGCENLLNLDISSFDTSKVTDMGFMFSGCSSLTSLKLSNFNTKNVVNMSYMFRYCSSLTELDISGFNTRKVTNMSWMFAFSSALRNLNIANFDTRSLIDMMGMFYGNSALLSIKLGDNFDKINGTDMFSNCTRLTAIITTSTTPMALSTDIGVEEVTKLYVPTLEAEAAFENVTEYAEVFGADRIRPILEFNGDSRVVMTVEDEYIEKGALVAGMTKNADETYTPYGYTVIIDTPEITGTGVYRVTYTIYENGDTNPGMSIERLVVVLAGDYLMSRESGTATYILGAKRQSEETGEALYLNYTSDKVKTITLINTGNTSAPTSSVASWDVSKEYGDNKITAWISQNTSDTSMLDLVIGSDKQIVASSGTNLFANYSNCTSITGLEYLNTELITSMQNMFSGCLKLPSLEVEKISTNSASTMEGMFKNCNTLTSLNLSNMLTIMCKNMKDMFSGCSNIQTLNVTKFYTANVKNMSGMFEGCSSLTNLNVKYFDTTNVENFASMFNGCSNLIEIDVKYFMTSKAKSVGAMFKDCSSLETLDLSNFNLNALDGETYTNSIDGVKNINQNFMFDGCTKLEAIVLGKKFARINGTNMFRNCNTLETIIAQSETPMTLSTNTGISNAKIYVQKQANVASYKAADNYTTVFGNEGVRALLEVIGENKVQVPLGSSYTDQGATVAGYSEADQDKYERFGYTLTTTGLPIDTNTMGKYHVIYKLYYFDQTIDTASN